jgi:hypothetical protein
MRQPHAFSPSDRELRNRWNGQIKARVRRGARFPTGTGGKLERMTYNHAQAAQALIDFGVGTGEAFPSHEAVAGHIGMSVDLVKVACQMLKMCGLLDWCQRWHQDGRGFQGSKRQTSNAYVFLLPELPAGYGAESPRRQTPSKQASSLRGRAKGLVRGVVDSFRPGWEAQAAVRTPQEQIEALLGRQT